MEKSSKRGKIPPQDWPSIISRYQAGETLASIARTYDCSPPAISYIVSRSRARSAAAGAPGVAAPQEPQLVKSHPGGTPLAASRSTRRPMVIASTTSTNKETGNLGSTVLGGLALEWSRGIAQAMDNLGLFFLITGVGLIVVGVVRERRGIRKM